MIKQAWAIAVGGSLCATGSLYAQVVPGTPPAPEGAPQGAQAQAAEDAKRRAAERQADREAAVAREKEALSRPASWLPFSITELERSVGGRTMIEVKVQNATLDEVAAFLRAQSGLDIFTRSQLTLRLQAPDGARTGSLTVASPWPGYDLQKCRHSILHLGP